MKIVVTISIMMNLIFWIPTHNPMDYRFVASSAPGGIIVTPTSSSSLVDEVWTIKEKYLYDRTFNNQVRALFFPLLSFFS